MDETIDAKEEFKEILEDALEETGADLSASIDDVAQYMSERAEHLALIIDEPGYSQALRAERNNVAMRAGLKISDDASAIDHRIVGIIQGALRLAAASLA